MSIKTWRARATERGIGSCEARDEELIELRAALAALKHAASALLHQIDIGDFVDSHGHSAKMLKPVHDLMRNMKCRT